MVNVHLLIAFLMGLCVAAFRFGGGRPLLNTVDYSTIADARAFNRFVAARMTLPLAVSLGNAWFTAQHPFLLVPLIFLFWISLLVVVIWIAAGSRDFSK